MRKKAISIMLALAMTLALFPATIVSAAGTTLSTDKTNYAAGETIVISYSGILAEQITAQSWIGMAKQGAPASSYIGSSWDYVKQGSGTITLKAPTESGSYEIRFYQGYSANEANYVKSATMTFSVGISSNNNNSNANVGQGQNDNTVIRYPTYADFDWSLVNFETGKHSFTGTYDTSFKTLSMTQSGDSVTGQYPEWDNGRLDGVVVDGVLYGYWYESPSHTPPNDAGQIVFVMNADGKEFTGWWRYGNSGSWRLWSKGTRNQQNISDWAAPTVQKAESMDLIPDVLKGADLTKPITRAEYAAVSIKVFENLTGVKTVPAAVNPFKDTNNTEILKSYNHNLMIGISADEFAPNVLLNRETMAAALTKVWIQANTLRVGSYTLSYSRPAPFADDSKISDWAKDSVYFMAANAIVAGTGNNMFSPRAITSAEVAMNYAVATREQALIIAVRMVDNLKGKLPSDTGGGDGTTTPTSTATPPSSGSLTLEKIKQTAISMGYDILDGYNFDNDSAASEPFDGVYICTTTGNESVTCVSVIVFATAPDAQKYVDYFNKTKTQYPSVYAKYSAFSYEKFYFTIEDTSSNAGKDVLTSLIPNWESLIK